MPVICDYTPDKELVVFRHIGDVPDDEFLAAYREFFQSSDVIAAIRLLVDLSETVSSPRSSQALRSLAELMRKVYGGGETRRRVAVVAPADLSFGLARMYQVFSDNVPWEFVVFRDADAARAWLGISDVLNGGEEYDAHRDRTPHR